MLPTAVLNQGTSSADSSTEDHFPWDIEPAASVLENDTWLLSFVDILSLLLALFVLLLAQEYQHNNTVQTGSGPEPVRVSIASKPLPLKLSQSENASRPGRLSGVSRPFSTIQLPTIPQIVAPLGRLHRPVTKPSPPVAKAPLPRPEEHSPVKEVTAAAHSRINKLLETLRTSELADRIDIQTRTDSVRLDIADSILFAPARTRLTNSGLILLKDLAKTLKTLPWSLSVEGHTDSVPIQTARFPSNWELSTARATMVARELIRHGVHPDRIRAIGYADTQPRADNATAAGRNRNRRVTFVLELPEKPGISD